LYVLVAEGTTLLERRRYRIPEVKMIPSNLNRCRFEILENNKQTRESTALSVAYNVERWRRGWEGIVGRRRRVATWTYPYSITSMHGTVSAPATKLATPIAHGAKSRHCRRSLRQITPPPPPQSVAVYSGLPWQFAVSDGNGVR
jgi:hypothetical protein